MYQAEELNRFRQEDIGGHYGYPYCWTEFSLPETVGNGTGTVWTWPDFLNQNYTDDQCRTEYIPPVVAMQAHSAPLGITFYQWNSEVPLECLDVQPFPGWMDGYAFIAYHGSWNRDVPTGYKIVYIAMNETGDAIGQPIDLLAHQPPDAKWEDGFRPVDVDFDSCGRLIVTSDGSGDSGSKLVRIEWLGLACEEPSSAPSIEQVSTTPSTNSSSSPTSGPSSTMPSTSSEVPSEGTRALSSSSPSVGPSCIPTEPTGTPSIASSCQSSSNATLSIRSFLTALLFSLFFYATIY
jgi:hypothetical protein